jgi:response regulator RpfG family c-di-GMP phosphodiesterase
VRILLTGYTDVSSLIEAINCGHVYKYVTKPWNNEEFIITVSRALAHYDALKGRHNLQMVNDRLQARLNEIAELATSDDKSLPESRMNHVVREPELATVSAR